jgi:NAD(P)-dependent dehydrogenase (short-subunit alcohol dehydrogenase family)
LQENPREQLQVPGFLFHWLKGDSMPNIQHLSNKTILITGATDGIGKETARQLAMMDAQVILHGRNPEKAERVREEIIVAASNEKVETMIADLSSLNQVRSLADQVRAKHEHLDVLINNAGIYTTKKALTSDGYEMTFAVNHLSHFLLTNLLLDLVIASAPARIITVSSSAHTDARFDIENLNAEKKFHGWGAYCISKLANLLFTFALARRLEGSGVTANSLHPGFINTNILGRDIAGRKPVTEGAQTPVYLASSKEVGNVSGQYFYQKKITPPSELSRNVALQEEFWEISKKMTNLEN